MDDLFWINFAYFPWVVLCSRCIIIKCAKAHTLTGRSLYLYINYLICACHALDYGIASWQWYQQQNKSWDNLVQYGCEMPHQFWTDEHISQRLDTTHKNSEVIVNEWMKEKGYECSVEECRTNAAIHKGYKTILSILILTFGTCCQAEPIKTICFGCWDGCVPLQTNRSRVCMESIWDRLC